jgi:hypothetical protein
VDSIHYNLIIENREVLFLVNGEAVSSLKERIPGADGSMV